MSLWHLQNDGVPFVWCTFGAPWKSMANRVKKHPKLHQISLETTRCDVRDFTRATAIGISVGVSVGVSVVIVGSNGVSVSGVGVTVSFHIVVVNVSFFSAISYHWEPSYQCSTVLETCKSFCGWNFDN
jgi:hypothetical protein